jgi:hypothetical protein
MKTSHSVESGADALLLTGIGLGIAAGAATLIQASVGLTRLALFLAVG